LENFLFTFAPQNYFLIDRQYVKNPPNSQIKYKKYLPLIVFPYQQQLKFMIFISPFRGSKNLGISTQGYVVTS